MPRIRGVSGTGASEQTVRQETAGLVSICSLACQALTAREKLHSLPVLQPYRDMYVTQ